MSVIPEQLTLQVWKGTTFTKRFVLNNPDGTPMNLTGYTATFTLYDPNTNSIIQTFDTDLNGGVTIGNVAGGIDILIPAATVSSFLWQVAKYDLKTTAPDAEVDAWLRGAFNVLGP